MEKSRHHPKPRKATTKLFLKLTMAHRFRIGMLARIRIGKITKTGMRLGNGRLGVLSKAGSDTDLRRWFQLLGRTDFAISYCSDKKKRLEPSGLTIITSPRVSYDFCCLTKTRWTPPGHQAEFPPSTPPSHPPLPPPPPPSKGPQRDNGHETPAEEGCRSGVGGDWWVQKGRKR